MRRTRMLGAMLAVAALTIATAAPASAGPAEKTTYIVAECDGVPVAPPDAIWETGQNGIHIRGAMNLYTEYVLIEGEWVEVGTNTTNANGNAKLPDFSGPFWGGFSYRDDGTIGNFDGTWSWGNATYGRASGKSADGRLLKVTLGLDDSSYRPLPGECGVAEFLVIEPRG